MQVSLDGAVLYTGPLQGSYYYYYYDDPPHVSGNLGFLAPGRHTLSLRVTRQAISPASYAVSGRVELLFIVNNRLLDTQGASWEEPVTLATGEAWTGEFEIRDW